MQSVYSRVHAPARQGQSFLGEWLLGERLAAVTPVLPANSFISAGMDGCRGGWVCAGWDGRNWSMVLFEDLQATLTCINPGATVCIDMPIGLSDSGVRACDTEARKLLGERRGSVFAVPPRLALSDKNYPELNAASKRHCGRGISKQAFFLLPKIRETEQHLTANAGRCEHWVECHPELCFSALNGGMPMTESKKTSAGYRQRFAVLERHMAYPELPHLVSSALSLAPRSRLAKDDILDALVCGLVARLEPSQRHCLPHGRHERDEVGRLMQICYPSTVLSMPQNSAE